jgi:hypothetical protein
VNPSSLAYGEEVDWLKNALAAGRTTVEAKGERYAVGEPEIIDTEAALPLLPSRLRRTWRLFGIERLLKVKRLPDAIASEVSRLDGSARMERLSP